jgi:hypothetical protein
VVVRAELVVVVVVVVQAELAAAVVVVGLDRILHIKYVKYCDYSFRFYASY